MKRNAIIKATASYAPEWELSNDYFNDLLGEDVGEWLSEKMNIHHRRWCKENESVADLCEKAARSVVQKAAIKPEEIDLIIVATDTPEYVSPSTAAVLQERLAATNAGTFDLNAACAGFVTAIDVASKYINADANYTNVLVIGGYAMSKYLNLKDKKTVTLFGDGAGAVLLSAHVDDKPVGVMFSELKTEGEYNSWMGVYGGATHKPINAEVLENADHKLKFVQRFPTELNPDRWTKMIRYACDQMGISPNDVHQYLITQLNCNAIDETLNRLDVPLAKAHKIMDKFGYTGSACIPLALDDAMQSGKIAKGNWVMLLGSGAGLAFASALIKI
jgi:3-oxoacyl-[acyl-carrier-protein] synthase-3